MFKKPLALTAIIIILTLIILMPSYAANEQEGYPYDDEVNYSYYTETEYSFDNLSLEDKPKQTDARYEYFIRVRDRKTLKILSFDRLEILLPGLPSYIKHENGTAKIDIPSMLYSTIEEPDKPLLRNRELEIKHYHDVSFQMSSAQSTWEDFVKSKKTEMSDSSNISEGSFMGHKALTVDQGFNSVFNKETDTELFLNNTKYTYVYLENARMPNGILMLMITSVTSSNGEYSSNLQIVYNEKFRDVQEKAFEKYSKEFKDEVRKVYEDEKKVVDGILNSMSGVKPKITKTVGMTVPYTGASNGKEIDDKSIDDKSNKNVVIDTVAKEAAGEESYTIPAAIITGVISGAVAMAAAGAAGAAGAGAAGTVGASTSGAENSSGKQQDQEQKTTYKMVISKNFGDAIKYNQEHNIKVRITEYKDGRIIERPDLTQQISIFSNEILVGAVVMEGVNMTAGLSIQETAPPEGILSFHYSGPLAYFQNNVKFRLLGKGQIKFATDKVNILSTDTKPYELVYELINFLEDEPPAEVISSSGYVKLDLGKNDKNQNVLFISPGSDAENWDHTSFTKNCECELSLMDDRLPIRALFEVTVCFEGIGTAYEHLKINEVEKDLTVKCYDDKKKDKREEGAIRIPLTVMSWDEKSRILEPDIAKSSALEFKYSIDPDFEFNSPLSKRNAEKFLTGAKLTEKVITAPDTLKIDKEKKPSVYSVMANDNPSGGAAPFGMNITVFCTKDNAMSPIELKAMIEPKSDFKGMVQWFLEYPDKSSVSKYLKLGDVSIYHGALDFIENRVYPISGVPWKSNMTWLASRDSHYEPGEDNILRKSYIAITDSKFPKEIGKDNFIGIQTLVHELTHVIEHQHGEYKVTDKSETNAYYLQYLSDIGANLTDIENPSGTTKASAKDAIAGFYRLYTDTEIRGSLNNINTWFGAKKLEITSHRFFDMYAYHTDSILRDGITEEHKNAIADAFQTQYFPGNLSSTFFSLTEGSIRGYFIETDGPFKGAQWEFRWLQGALLLVALSHNDYTFEISDYRWVGGNEMKLKILANVKEKQSISWQDDLKIYIDCGTYNMDSEVFFDVRAFSTFWNSLSSSDRSLLYKKTGSINTMSWAERKK